MFDDSLPQYSKEFAQIKHVSEMYGKTDNDADINVFDIEFKDGVDHFFGNTQRNACKYFCHGGEESVADAFEYFKRETGLDAVSIQEYTKFMAENFGYELDLIQEREEGCEDF